MTALHQLSACEAAAQLAQRTLRAEDLVRACIEHIDARKPEEQAWADTQNVFALAHAQTQVQLFELAHNLAHEHIAHFAELSPRLQGILKSGKDITHAQYDAAQLHIASALR